MPWKDHTKANEIGAHRRGVKNNREAYNAYMREMSKVLRARLRLEVIEAYGGACACCGERTTEFLSIDHIAGGGRKHRASIPSGDVYGWLRRQGYPAGYRLLCHNCNMAMGLYHYCPHHPADKPAPPLAAPRDDARRRTAPFGDSKTCTSCGTMKLRAEFYDRPRVSPGHDPQTSHCRACYKRRYAERYQRRELPS